MTAELLRVENLSVAFETRQGRVEALRGVSFALREGEILGIVGESGSGKSVTCRALLRLLPEAARVQGRIGFDGRDLLALSEPEMRAVRGRDISMIFQNATSHFDPLMTVGRHIAEPLRFHFGQRGPASRAEAVRLLDAVGIAEPERRVDAYPHELSGGMRQRAMIAGAIACRPRVMLADEPTTAVDVTIQARILELLRRLNREQGLSIVLISHDLGVIAELCDRVVVMKDGAVVEEGATRSVVRRPNHPYTRLLVDSQPAVRFRDEGLRSRAVPKSLETEPPVLAVENLTVEFALPSGPLDWLRGRKARRFRAVDDASFEVRQGETLGIVGESGSGKSTVARAIAHLVEPAAGRIRFRGEPVGALKGERLLAYRRAVQMVFQSPYDSLNPRLTVRQTLAEPLWRHRLVARADLGRSVEALMARVELPMALADRRPWQLSGGQCQRVGIARALAMQPQVLIADEVTSALDVTTQAQILALLQRLREEEGLVIVYISHDLSVVRGFCHRVAVFRDGRIVEAGATEAVFAEPRHDYTRMLIDSAPKLDAPEPDAVAVAPRS